MSIEILKKKKMNREILRCMRSCGKDKWAWNVILKDTLEKLETFNIKEK
jgi:hypothetical protein